MTQIEGTKEKRGRDTFINKVKSRSNSQSCRDMENLGSQKETLNVKEALTLFTTQEPSSFIFQTKDGVSPSMIK